MVMEETVTLPKPILTPEQRFRRSVYRCVGVGAFFLFYLVIADQFMPVTSEVRVIYDTTRIAPEVSGTVVRVNVDNDQPIKAGEVLFEIDPTRYELNVTSARLALEQAELTIRQRDADIAEARAAIASAKATADDAIRQANRKLELSANNTISKSDADTAVANRDESVAALHVAEARLRSSIVLRGDEGPDNLYLREARNNLAIAERDLSKTKVALSEGGTVTNMHLRPGNYVSAGAPVMAVVGLNPTIGADFREKALSRVHVGDPAYVTFDALPGQVFNGHVSSIDAGIAEGQINADGSLVEIVETDRWIRRAQRVRVNVTLETPPEVVSGGRATVQLVPNNSWFSRVFAQIQIRVLALSHYVY